MFARNRFANLARQLGFPMVHPTRDVVLEVARMKLGNEATERIEGQLVEGEGGEVIKGEEGKVVERELVEGEPFEGGDGEVGKARIVRWARGSCCQHHPDEQVMSVLLRLSSQGSQWVGFRWVEGNDVTFCLLIESADTTWGEVERCASQAHNRDCD